MSKNVTLWGASYSNVPALLVPQTGGGTARFTDTSPTTATDSDVASGKIYFKSDGTQSTGTGSGGGGGSDAHVGWAEDEPQNANVILFSTDGFPTSFIVLAKSDVTPSSDASQISAYVWDGGQTIEHNYVQTITNTANAQVTYDNGGAYPSMGDDYLSLFSVSPNEFSNMTYACMYSYGATVTIDTKTQSVGSGATSITFTGLAKNPLYFACIFTSNFSTSSGYQRVIAVCGTDGDSYGVEMDSSAHYSNTHWSYSYSNGSLTISSQGTNAGGYFHQPGDYLLVYAYDSDTSYQDKTVTPTTSQQVVEADTGYLALSSVTVNPIPSSYVQPTSTVGATTYRATTTAQTIASGTYHSAQATISAISQTNLTAGNIKSGTTVTISNGQSNIFSVTGTYTGGGGGESKNVQISQSTTRNNASSLTKANGDLTVSKTGTYDIYWTASRSNTSTSYTWGSRLYVDGTAYGTENTSWSNNVQNNHLTNVSLTANQKLAVYTRGRSGSYYTYAPMLVIVES